MPENETSDLALVDQKITVNTLKQFIGTPTIPRRYKSLSDCIAAVMYGKEIGLAPMESLQQLHVINGSVGLSGKALSALIHQAGHILVMDEMSAERGAVKAMRRDPFNHELIEVGMFEFTWADAEAAGLDGQDTYTMYPKDMLYWRAVSRAAKLAFPDVTTGLLLPEEIGGPYEAIPAEDAALAVLESSLSAKEEAHDMGYGHDDSYGE